MSFRSESRIRSVIVASTGLSLLGVMSVFVDFRSASGAFSVTEASNASTAASRQLPTTRENGPKHLSANAGRYFKPASGKQDRADIADALPPAPPQKALAPTPAMADQPEFITASLVDMPAGGMKPQQAPARPLVSIQDVNRGSKGDRLPVAMTVAKFSVQAMAEPMQPDVHGSAAAFLVSPPLAEVRESGDATPAPQRTRSIKPADAGQAEAAPAPSKGPVDDRKLSSDDMRPGGKSYWDELVKMASIKGEGAGEKPVFFGGFTEKEEHARQLRCLATAVYFEARDEPLRGQIAVAQVILTRVKSEFYPKTICEVVYQGAQHKNSCQFSFACDGKADVVREKKEWATSLDVARQVISGKVYLTDISDSTHYHATYVHPEWRKQVRKIKQIGTHIFYKADFAPPLVANADYKM